MDYCSCYQVFLCYVFWTQKYCDKTDAGKVTYLNVVIVDYNRTIVIIHCYMLHGIVTTDN